MRTIPLSWLESFTSMYTKIKDLEDLKTRASEEGGCECFIALNSLVRSSKQVWYWSESNTWDVHNDIDGTDIDGMTFDELKSDTNIIKALNAGALYAY